MATAVRTDVVTLTLTGEEAVGLLEYLGKRYPSEAPHISQTMTIYKALVRVLAPF